MTIATKEPWQALVCAATGSMLADTVVMPLDVVKVRLQLASSGMLGESYKGGVDCMATILRNHGVRGLYKGLSPALLRSGTYGTTRIALYEPFKKVFAGDTPRSQMALHHRVLAGLCSGSLSSFVFNPADVLKIRMQGDKSGAKYRSLVQTARVIVKEEGVLALWKGVTPSVLRASVCACVELCTYDEVKLQLLQSRVWPFADSLPTHIVASVMAGFFSTLLSHPIDLVKARLMNQGSTQVYKSLLDCCVKSVKQDGIRGLYAGFWPSFFRVGPHTTVVFVVVEQVRQMTGWADDRALQEIDIEEFEEVLALEA